MTDAVNHPAHYQLGQFEAIDIIEAVVSRIPDAVTAYSISNALKYLLRYPRKDGTQDLQKAAWYLARAISNSQQCDRLCELYGWRKLETAYATERD